MKTPRIERYAAFFYAWDLVSAGVLGEIEYISVIWVTAGIGSALTAAHF
ncbi:hypothetical protein [Pseudomonas sp. SDO5271_S396]